MRWVIAMSASCGRLAFDEVPPDAAPSDAAEVTCVMHTFDQPLEGLTMYSTDGAVELIGGQVKFSISGAINSDVGLARTEATSFVGRAVAIQVQPARTQSASTTFGWHEGTGDRIGVHLEMDGFSLKLNQFNPTLERYDEFVSRPFDAIEHAWWRFREERGDIVAEVSRDGAIWNAFGSVSGRDVSSMTWDIGLGSYITNVAASEATMDNASDCAP